MFVTSASNPHPHPAITIFRQLVPALSCSEAHISDAFPYHVHVCDRALRSERIVAACADRKATPLSSLYRTSMSYGQRAVICSEEDLKADGMTIGHGESVRDSLYVHTYVL